MGLYLYCLGRSSHPVPSGIEGIAGAPVRSDQAAGFAVWVSDLDGPPAASLDRVRDHNRVVEAASTHVTPLPFRFGQWFASREAMVGSLDERAGRLASGLEHVDGAMEYGVRVIDPAHREEPRDRGSGKAYIESLARRARGAEVDHSRARDVAAALRASIGPLIRDERVRLVAARPWQPLHTWWPGTILAITFAR